MIYVITDGTGFVKIGIAKDVQTRLKELQCGCPRDLILLRTIETADDASTEYCLHAIFEAYRARPQANVYHSEWFQEDCFLILKELSDDQIWMITQGLHWRYTNATPLPGIRQNPPGDYSEQINKVREQSEKINTLINEIRKKDDIIKMLQKEVRKREKEIDKANRLIDELDRIRTRLSDAASALRAL